MAKLKRRIIKVEGNYPFPIDMLRYDAVWPRTETDSYNISRSFHYAEAKMTVEVIRNAESSWKPTYGRWESFGWKVISDTVSDYQ